jgi:hypothetical protein
MYLKQPYQVNYEINMMCRSNVWPSAMLLPISSKRLESERGLLDKRFIISSLTRRGKIDSQKLSAGIKATCGLVCFFC